MRKGETGGKKRNERKFLEINDQFIIGQRKLTIIILFGNQENSISFFFRSNFRAIICLPESSLKLMSKRGRKAPQRKLYIEKILFRNIIRKESQREVASRMSW